MDLMLSGPFHVGVTSLWGDESRDRVREIKEGVWPAAEEEEGGRKGRGERKRERRQ